MIGRSVILYEKMTRDTPLMLFNAFGGQTILQIVIGLVIPAKPRFGWRKGARLRMGKYVGKFQRLPKLGNGVACPFID
ncbi:hypothetical protein A9308_05070 [Moraxella atlantae]|uniref:Uncharacterized protein n=2 Tax=Faucicola atlantae TaxID=34059 RepID=A0A1B8QE68_9GAMM|nr:hypothetical protein A9308_05070 [Moraxella atlantae]